MCIHGHMLAQSNLILTHHNHNNNDELMIPNEYRFCAVFHAQKQEVVGENRWKQIGINHLQLISFFTQHPQLYQRDQMTALAPLSVAMFPVSGQCERAIFGANRG